MLVPCKQTWLDQWADAPPALLRSGGLYRD